MADILAVGLSHFPFLTKPDETMIGFVPAMLKNPALPAHWRDPANWPAPMRAEWGDDAGRSAAERHREQLLAGMRACRAAIDDFDPDLVIILGDDQYENFLEDCIPAYCVNAHPQFTYKPPKGNIWNEPEGTTFHVPGNQPFGKLLATELLRRGFDTAYSYKPLHDELGHAFTNALLFLDYDRTGFDYPLLPLSVNSYGKKVVCQKGGFPDFSRTLDEAAFDPPGPMPWRLYDLGAALVDIVRDLPLRIALVASSGWSHGFLIPEHDYLYPDVAADRELYDALLRRDYAFWRNYPAERIERSGQQEGLNWMPLVGALDALGRGPGETSFLETWIFNSSKVFLVSRQGD